MPGDSQEQQALPLEFTGSGSEYFRIWIVNCVLTVLTLGIYSAWAKVRRLQYFYQNTALDGSAFDYHGNAKAILKGRIFGFSLLVIYNLAFEFSMLWGMIIALLLLLLMPWFVRQTLRFRLHNSSYRGLRFHFNGTNAQAYRNLLVPLLLLGGLGWVFFYFAEQTPALILLLPFFLLALYFSLGAKAHYLLKNFQHGKSAFGQSRFRFSAVEGDFTRVYGKVLGIGLIIALAAIWLINPSLPGSSSQEQAQTAADLIRAGACASEQPAADSGCEEEETEGAEEAPPAEPTAEEKKELEMARWYFRIGPALGLLFVYLFLSAPFFDARIHNLIWNHTKLDEHRLVSRVQARRLYWLHITNWLGIMFTVGLYKPFAQVRLYRYKLTCLSLVPFGDLEEFVGKKADEVSAAGEEVGEAFDIDLSL